MSNHRMCCCQEVASDAWYIGVRCDGEPLVPPVPVLSEERWRQGGCGIPEEIVIAWNGVCYFWAPTSSSVNLPSGPDGTNYVDVGTGTLYCACWMCEEGVDPVDPTPGNPDDGAANCCPSDTGCTTFGSNVIEGRVNVSGSVSVTTRCSFNPDTFVTNEYTFTATLTLTGSSCSLIANATEVKAQEVWATCSGTLNYTPEVLVSINYDTDSGLVSASAQLRNIPVPQNATGYNFALRLRGGDSDFVPLGGWSQYVQSGYSYNEFVTTGCENVFAASGAFTETLNNSGGSLMNEVVASMTMSGAIDKLGACP